jgi:hypothetical protein
MLVMLTSFHGIKKARLRRDGLDEWITVRLVQDAGGTSTHTLLPDAGPVPLGYWHQGISFSIAMTPRVHF